jgi:hypothetical protein
MTLPDELPLIGARALAGIGITRLSQLTEHRASDRDASNGLLLF